MSSPASIHRHPGQSKGSSVPVPVNDFSRLSSGQPAPIRESRYTSPA